MVCATVRRTCQTVASLSLADSTAKTAVLSSSPALMSCSAGLAPSRKSTYRAAAFPNHARVYLAKSLDYYLSLSVHLSPVHLLTHSHPFFFSHSHLSSFPQPSDNRAVAFLLHLCPSPSRFKMSNQDYYNNQGGQYPQPPQQVSLSLVNTNERKHLDVRSRRASSLGATIARPS